MFFSHAIPHYTMLLLWQSHSEAGTVELTIAHPSGFSQVIVYQLLYIHICSTVL